MRSLGNRRPVRPATALAVLVAAVLALATGLAASTFAGAASAAAPRRAVSAASTTKQTPTQQTATVPRTVGLLGPTNAQLQSLVGSHVTRVMIPLGWSQVEPQQNVFNTSGLAQFAANLTTLRNAGYQIVLDPGLQYAPSWVFSLPGATRFVNQYGDAWHGSTGEDVPNAVFDPAVRSAEATYLAQLSQSLGATTFAAIRVGGLLSGELRYPDADYLSDVDSVWDYDAAAQANAPYPGWKPGSGTATQIRSSLQYYFNSLTGYETWLMKTTNSDFPGVNQQVMLPGWGLRPGMVDDAVSTGMTNRSNAEVNGMIASGLDWANQVPAIASSGVNGTVYTTWLDATAQAATPQGEAPVDYLATLATQSGLPIAGENTGGGGTSALQLCVQRAQADHLTSFMYMSGPAIDNGSAGIALSDLTNAATTLTS